MFNKHYSIESTIDAVKCSINITALNPQLMLWNVQ